MPKKGNDDASYLWPTDRGWFHVLLWGQEWCGWPGPYSTKEHFEGAHIDYSISHLLAGERSVEIDRWEYFPGCLLASRIDRNNREVHCPCFCEIGDMTDRSVASFLLTPTTFTLFPTRELLHVSFNFSICFLNNPHFRTSRDQRQKTFNIKWNTFPAKIDCYFLFTLIFTFRHFYLEIIIKYRPLWES